MSFLCAILMFLFVMAFFELPVSEEEEAERRYRGLDTEEITSFSRKSKPVQPGDSVTLDES